MKQRDSTGLTYRIGGYQPHAPRHPRRTSRRLVFEGKNSIPSAVRESLTLRNSSLIAQLDYPHLVANPKAILDVRHNHVRSADETSLREPKFLIVHVKPVLRVAASRMIERILQLNDLIPDAFTSNHTDFDVSGIAEFLSLLHRVKKGALRDHLLSDFVSENATIKKPHFASIRHLNPLSAWFGSGLPLTASRIAL